MTIHETLKSEILERIAHMAPGTKIQTEAELCEEFKVSRMTVNRVVTELSHEGCLVRRRPLGTFVAERPQSAQKVIFALPCADFLTRNDTASAITLRRLAHGVVDAVRVGGGTVEFLSASPDNDNTHIDFASFRRCNANCAVILPGAWFNPLFPLLRECGANVGLIIADTLSESEQEQCSDFHIFRRDLTTAIHDSVVRLHQAGRRRIALVSLNLRSNHSRLAGYQQAVRELELPELVLYRGKRFGRLDDHEHHMLNDMHCDGVVFDATNLLGATGQDINEAANLPPELDVIAFGFSRDLNFIDHIPETFDFNEEQIGSEMVKVLFYSRNVKIIAPVQAEFSKPTA